MLGSRFLWQIWGVLGFTLVISTLVFGYFVADQIEQDALDRVEQDLLKQALALAPRFATYLDSRTVLAPDTVTQLTPGITARITLIDEQGEVLADNNSKPEVMDNHISRPEVIASSQSSYGVAARYSNTLDLSMLYLAIPVKSELGRPGFLRLALPLTTIEDQMQTLQNRIYLTAGTAGFFFLMMGYFLAYRVTSPIVRMTEIARNIARGEYHLRLPTDRVDELGQLSVVINELAFGAQGRIDDLTSNRNRLAAVLAALTEGVIAVDLNQRVLHINHAALGMLGLSLEQVLSKKFDELPTTWEIKQAVSTCVIEGTNVVATIKVGTETLECSCVRMDTGGEEGEGALLVLEDITERLRLEAVRSDFVANASHELKTPISAIRGLVETIIDDPDMTEEVHARFVERIRQQTIRLGRIVQDLLHLSRFDSADDAKKVARLELGSLLHQVYQAKSYDANDLNVALSVDVPAEGLYVDGEAEALNQLVTNLVDNALKYSGEGGVVNLRLFKRGAMAHIEVEDNGIGISREETQRIFERFYRVDRARSRDLGGTGLGLAIVKHIAQGHGGSVSVESQPGKGSVFCAQLPLAEGT